MNDGNYRSLKEHVHHYIATQIMEGKLKPSERVNESAISEILSVSRTPVREALIQLSCEDILENVPRKGFILKPIALEEAMELFTVIGYLDALSAKLALGNLTERDLSNMLFYTESMDAAIRTDNYEMYIEQQKQFHYTYMNKCGNSVLIDTLSRLKNKFFAKGYDTSQDEILYLINDEHRKILQFFKDGDKEGVADYLMNVHWAPRNAHLEVIEK